MAVERLDDEKLREAGAYVPKEPPILPLRWTLWVLNFIRKKPLGGFGLVVALALIVMAILAPAIATHDPIEISAADRLSGPSSDHLFGTDDKGRDIFSQIVHGARVSVTVGVISVAVSLLVGVPLGLVSGYLGGKTDMVIQRLFDAQMAIPGLILAMTISEMLGPSIRNVMIAIGVITAPAINRVVRGSVLVVKEEMYVEAARSVGSTNVRVLARHVLPNVMAPILIIATSGLGAAILIEASLSFIGFGTPPPDASWGRMLNDSQRFLETAWWMAIFPGVAISIAVLGFNLMGDALRDVLDPRMRNT